MTAKGSGPRPIFHRTRRDWRRWLEKHHDGTSEVLLGFYRKESGRGGITYPEALDEALCFGWIDGVRKRWDDDSYTIRFTPRTRRSIWSAVNIKRAGQLIEEGTMTAAGLRAFEGRDPARAKLYSYEREHAVLDPACEREFRRNVAAWAFFTAQPPSYRKVAAFFVMGAKKDETRQRRLARLIDDSMKRRRIGLLGSAK